MLGPRLWRRRRDAVPLNVSLPTVVLSYITPGIQDRLWKPAAMLKISSVAGRSPLFALSVSAGAVIIFLFGFMAWQSPSRIPQAFHGHVETYVYSIACYMGRQGLWRRAAMRLNRLQLTSNLEGPSTRTPRPCPSTRSSAFYTHLSRRRRPSHTSANPMAITSNCHRTPATRRIWARTS